MSLPRWYVRCSDCLSVAAVHSSTIPPPCECVCGGKIEAMGRVTRDPLARMFGRKEEHLQTGVRYEEPCDARRTNARGPSCNCPCGAENHGTQRLVEIEIVQGIPRLLMLDPHRARERASEYRDAVAVAREAVDRRYPSGRVAAERKASGEYIDSGAFSAMLDYRRAREAVARARALRTHGGRLKALQFIARNP